MPSSLAYNPPGKESSPPAIVPTLRETRDHQQPLDHHHLQQQHQQQQQQHGIINPPSQPTKPKMEIQETDLDALPVSSAPPHSPTFNSFKSSGSMQHMNLMQLQSQTTPYAVIPLIGEVRYKECMRNHAASMGGHIVDGCGEFMPGGSEGSPEFFKCVACQCHQNFHRKEIDGELQPSGFSPHFYGLVSKAIGSHKGSLSPSLQCHRRRVFQPTPINVHQHQRFPFGISNSTTTLAHPVMMAFGNGGAEESSSEDIAIFHAHDIGFQSGSKKRFRTKFTQQQKEKMVEFAERLGWRMQKQNEHEVMQFCEEVGVKRRVFKVWMHNNKQQAMKKQQVQG
ncbi:hypothetical protein MLD38_030873 [Melastoma candidum]|uniref:Uncharacterized protein n=1 Tax=Melastoma candidum TaxID=119954 RepID=A0ACB9MN00_9MYRT|nr:hypothetical protein MLD38_030873 [Melastoma candidum]